MATAMELTDFINDIGLFTELGLQGTGGLLHSFTEVQKDLGRKMYQPNIISLKKIKVKFHVIGKYVYCVTFDVLNWWFCDI
jgi:hypothetical protein